MTGEKLAWFRVASHLHHTVEELAEKVTYREFLSWLDYLNWAEDRTEKSEYYLAQIAAEVRRGYVKHPKSVKTKDFILKSVEKKQTMSKSKSTWLGFFNLKPSE
jgi:hypothetical protein